MLKYAIIFAVISLIAGALGFGGVAAGAAGIAKILFGLFLILAVDLPDPGRPRRGRGEKSAEVDGASHVNPAERGVGRHGVAFPAAAVPAMVG
jgi:uncharacterized membrane protein YtjA (UPF0391 family)